MVALETSIVGQGLPSPHNLKAARGCENAIREEGAIPATVAVLDGKLRIGLSDADLERIAAGSVKVSSRDLGPGISVRRRRSCGTLDSPPLGMDPSLGRGAPALKGHPARPPLAAPVLPSTR